MDLEEIWAEVMKLEDDDLWLLFHRLGNFLQPDDETFDALRRDVHEAIRGAKEVD